MAQEKIDELEFIDKENNCNDCKKEKEITMELGLTTIEEWNKIIPMLDKYGLSRDEINYIYGFYNRVFKTKKTPGCGKCFVNIAKHLKNRWNEINK
jgi:hypothetical protein